MNIEEGVKEIEKIKEMFIHLKNYGWINDIKKEIDVDKAIEAIETLITAYENLKLYNKGTKEALRVAEDLEHQANKEAGDWEAKCFELEEELEKEKEKNKNKDKILRNIRDEFLKYNWKDANPIQIYNQIKSLYESIYCKPYED